MNKRLFVYICMLLLNMPVILAQSTTRSELIACCDSDQYGCVVEFVNDSIVHYYTKNGETLVIPIPSNVAIYKGGLFKLKQSIYDTFASESNGEEVLGTFYILFDRKMKIIEIRAVNFYPVIQEWPVIVEPYIQYLQKTEGKWGKLRKGKEYYLAAVVLSVSKLSPANTYEDIITAVVA